ncbi:hypothetical protein BN2476_590005 [Paraburkholderia piptadeniae]|uniref:Enoyl-CoA hydratase n=1 Tax=Paraburkholderia piptadeniae TaxID=1701573 RepID=A0A1N7SJH5_9BURK|nr:hypothetical protein BN2476_590005 [Paraburkholderia piptadeniae]
MGDCEQDHFCSGTACRGAAKPAGSLTAMKRLMRNAERLVIQMNSESAILVERLASAEANEAFAVFAQRRQPDFTRIARQQERYAPGAPPGIPLLLIHRHETSSLSKA